MNHRSTSRPSMVLRAYRERWTSGENEQPVEILADDDSVEVSVSDGPDKASFAGGLAFLGGGVDRVVLVRDAGIRAPS